MTGERIRREIKRYWDSRCASYDRHPGRNGRGENEMLWRDELRRVFPPEQPKRKILDVGAGTGFLSFLLEKEGHEVIGVDFSQKMVKEAVVKRTATGSNVVFIQARAEELPFANGSFDAVVCRYLLWTLPDPAGALREWIRILRPGGKIVAVDGVWSYSSIYQGLSGMIRRLYQLLHERKKPFPRCYSKEVMKNLPFGRGIEMAELRRILLDAELLEVQVRDISHLMIDKTRNIPWYLRPAYTFPIGIASGVSSGNRQH
jgi:ubiquinone/menaquinone biosynthesis C-methylase UbiE